MLQLVRKKGNSKLTPVLALVFALGLAIAYINGANDVSKGIATLVGSGVTDYRRAVVWGTLWTGAGAVVRAFLATAMVQTFGRGLFASGASHPGGGGSHDCGCRAVGSPGYVEGTPGFDHPCDCGIGCGGGSFGVWHGGRELDGTGREDRFAIAFESGAVVGADGNSVEDMVGARAK